MLKPSCSGDLMRLFPSFPIRDRWSKRRKASSITPVLPAKDHTTLQPPEERTTLQHITGQVTDEGFIIDSPSAAVTTHGDKLFDGYGPKDGEEDPDRLVLLERSILTETTEFPREDWTVNNA
jgi:hypothetical protein